MHAIVGSTREGRCRPDADASLVRVDFEWYRFIAQRPMFSKVEHKYRSRSVRSFKN